MKPPLARTAARIQQKTTLFRHGVSNANTQTAAREKEEHNTQH